MFILWPEIDHCLSDKEVILNRVRNCIHAASMVINYIRGWKPCEMLGSYVRTTNTLMPEMHPLKCAQIEGNPYRYVMSLKNSISFYFPPTSLEIDNIFSI